MKKKVCLSGLILIGLVGTLVLAGMALGADPKAADTQTKEPAAVATPAQDPKDVEEKTKEPVAAPTPAKEGKVAEGETKAPDAGAAKGYDGKVVDAQTKAPIAGALITLGDQQVRADKDGAFHLAGAGETLKLRAPGYAAAGTCHLGDRRPPSADRPHPLHGEGAVSLFLRVSQQETAGSGQGSC